MMRTVFAGLGLVLIVSACASSKPPTGDISAAEFAESTRYQQAMGTVSSLETLGNGQVAIDRLTQLLGDPGMSRVQMAETLYKRAQLRAGTGNDLDGAVTDLKEILADYRDTHVASDAAAMLDATSQERDRLVGRLETDSLSPMERFEILFRLGRHQTAADIMFASALQPDMEYVLDMYQMGYLCDGDELAGPAYRIVEPDGTARKVQFCELAK